MSALELNLDWRAYVTDTPLEIQERQTQNLYLALKQLPEIELVARIPDPNVPSGGMAMGAAWLTDILLTEVCPGSLGSVFDVVRQRLPGTPIDVEIEVDGKKIVMKGVRPENFDSMLDKAKQIVKELSGK